MIQWDSNGLKGVSGKYEISIVPQGEGWMTVVWVGKTHITTLNQVESKQLAQQTAEMYLEDLTKTTRRLMDRIGYDDPTDDFDEGEE